LGVAPPRQSPLQLRCQRDRERGDGKRAGASKATFSLLTVDLDLNAGLTVLLKDLASAKVIPSIELKGVTAAGTVYDLKLGDVTLTTYHDTNSGHDMLTFAYQQVSLTKTPMAVSARPRPSALTLPPTPRGAWVSWTPLALCWCSASHERSRVRRGCLPVMARDLVRRRWRR
jgi:hypothetical protein